MRCNEQVYIHSPPGLKTAVTSVLNTIANLQLNRQTSLRARMKEREREKYVVSPSVQIRKAAKR